MSSKHLIYPELSFRIVGILYSVHNELGRFAKEKQYGDCLERLLELEKIMYQRELSIGDQGNRLDFFIEDKIILELKAKRFLVRQDFVQTQRYLQETQSDLALLVNFREESLKPRRIVRIEEGFRQNHPTHNSYPLV